jgi:hypothetical protein
MGGGTDKIMIAREEGGVWEIIPIHSIVTHDRLRSVVP